MSDYERRCYAIGSNSQIVSGIINRKRERSSISEEASATNTNILSHSLRVDSRWLGATLATPDRNNTITNEDGDVLIGYTAASSLYILRNAEQLLAATVSRDQDDTTVE